MTAKRALTTRPLPFLTFSTAVNMQVVDATPGNATKCREGAGVGVKQHLVTLAGVGHQPEGTTGAQLHVRDLDTPVNATDHQACFAPVELESLAQIEFQGYEGVDIDGVAGGAKNPAQVRKAQLFPQLGQRPHIAQGAGRFE